jgi:predicted site-specific integrase-resolvase
LCWRTGIDWLGSQTPRRLQGARIAILVPNNESLSPEQEMVQDLRSIMRWFSSRLYGLGPYTKKLNETVGRDMKEGGP